MAIVGKDGKVTLGANTVVGMGTWSLDGITTDELEASAFGDEWKQYEYGMKDGGTVSFNGHYEPTDTTGQQALQQANLYNSALTNLRLYINNTSYFEPCQTTGHFSPALTTGAPTPANCSVNITSINIGMDKSGLGTISFTGKVSGVMVRAV
jgi:hypothetical protein